MTYINTSKAIPKSMMDICILDILSDSNENKTYSQKNIMDILLDRYEIKADRKTLGRHLADMAECIDGLRYQEKTKVVNGEELTNKTGFWLENDNEFDITELLAITYGILSARHMPADSKRRLVKKIETISSKRFPDEIRDFSIEGTKPDDVRNQLFWNIEVINEAINKKRMIHFQLTYLNNKGNQVISNSQHLVYPMGIAFSNGDYQLVASFVKQHCDTPDEFQKVDQERSLDDMIAMMNIPPKSRNDLRSYRIDKIRNIDFVDEGLIEKEYEEEEAFWGDFGPKVVKPKYPAIDFAIREYMDSNPSLEDGAAIDSIFKIPDSDPKILSDMQDYFGIKNVSIEENTERFPAIKDARLIKVHSNYNVLLGYALSHTNGVYLLEPEWLHERYMKTITKAFGHMIEYEIGKEIAEGIITLDEAKQLVIDAIKNFRP